MNPMRIPGICLPNPPTIGMPTQWLNRARPGLFTPQRTVCAKPPLGPYERPQQTRIVHQLMLPWQAQATFGTTLKWESQHGVEPNSEFTLPKFLCIKKRFFFNYWHIWSCYSQLICHLHRAHGFGGLGIVAVVSHVRWAFRSALCLRISSTSCRQHWRWFKNSRNR